MHGVEVLIIDPIYLCALAGATQKMDASNLFHMGGRRLGMERDHGGRAGALSPRSSGQYTRGESMHLQTPRNENCSKFC